MFLFSNWNILIETIIPHMFLAVYPLIADFCYFHSIFYQSVER